MKTQEELLGQHPAPLGNNRKPRSRPRMNPLHEAAMRLADLGLSRSRSRTKDLVGLLLSHGARTWRASQPVADLRLHVSAQNGGAAIRLRLPDR